MKLIKIIILLLIAINLKINAQQINMELLLAKNATFALDDSKYKLKSHQFLSFLQKPDYELETIESIYAPPINQLQLGFQAIKQFNLKPNLNLNVHAKYNLPIANALPTSESIIPTDAAMRGDASINYNLNNNLSTTLQYNYTYMHSLLAQIPFNKNWISSIDLKTSFNIKNIYVDIELQNLFNSLQKAEVLNSDSDVLIYVAKPMGIVTSINYSF